MTQFVTSSITKYGKIRMASGRNRKRGWSLSIDGSTQSFVDLDDPQYMAYGSLKNPAKLLEGLISSETQPHVVHIGGGTLSIPRRIATTVPGSFHTVYEINEELLDLVLDLAPLGDLEASIDAEPIGGEVGIKKHAPHSVSAILLDAYNGGNVPPPFLEEEFYHDTLSALKPHGALVMNLIVDDEGMDQVQKQGGLMRSAFPSVHSLTSRRRYEGNATTVSNTFLIASRDDQSISRILDGTTRLGPSMSQVTLID